MRDGVLYEALRPTSGGAPIEPIAPGREGGTDWFPMAYDPDLGYVFFATHRWAMAMPAMSPATTAGRHPNGAPQAVR